MEVRKAIVDLKAAKEKLFALDKQAESSGCKAEDWSKAKQELARSVTRLAKVLA